MEKQKQKLIPDQWQELYNIGLGCLGGLETKLSIKSHDVSNGPNGQHEGPLSYEFKIIF